MELGECRKSRGLLPGARYIVYVWVLKSKVASEGRILVSVISIWAPQLKERLPLWHSVIRDVRILAIGLFVALLRVALD